LKSSNLSRRFQDLKLPCIAVGSPSPQLHWKMRGQPIPKNDRIRQLPDGSLQITRVVKEDAGSFTCMVTNKYGQDQVRQTLVQVRLFSKETFAKTLYFSQDFFPNNTILIRRLLCQRDCCPNGTFFLTKHLS
jgi:hypothetical protein